MLYVCIAVVRRGCVSWCVKVGGWIGGWGGGRPGSKFRVVAVFCSFLFWTPMVLSRLDDGGLRTNWTHINCCKVLLNCCSTWFVGGSRGRFDKGFVGAGGWVRRLVRG